MKLSHRIVTASAAVLIIASALVISTTTYLNMKNSEAKSRVLLTSVASGLAVTAQNIAKEAQIVSTTLAATFGTEIQNSEVDRNTLAHMTRAALQGTSDVLGITVVLEPNVLGEDTAFVGNEYSTEAGRFAPYFYKNNGSIGFRIAGINKASAQNWYYKALRKQNQHITEPYTFDVSGKNIVSASITTPIFDAKGNSIGGVVVDIDFNSLTKKLETANNYRTGLLAIVSEGGLWVNHSDQSRLGEHVRPAIETVMKGVTDQPNIQELGDRTFIMERFLLGNTGQYWFSAMSVTSDELTEKYRSTRNIALIVAVIAGIVGCGILWLIANSIAHPVVNLTGRMQRLANGNVAEEVQYINRNDEIGQMANALKVFVTAISERQTLQTEAEKEHEREVTRQQEAAALVEAFSGTAEHTLTQILNQFEELDQTSKELAEIAETT